MFQEANRTLFPVSEEDHLLQVIKAKVDRGEITVVHLEWFSRLKFRELNFLTKWWVEKKK